MPQQVISLDFHENQLLVYRAYQAGKRFFILRCGRRWGKTEFCSRIAVKAGYEKPGSLIWWVSPSYKLSAIGNKKFKRYLRKAGVYSEVIAKDYKDPIYYIFKNETELHFLTAENESQLIGEGVDLLIFDECAIAKRSAWEECLAPTLIDNPLSRAFFITTPGHKNWFYDLESHAISKGAPVIEGGKVVNRGEDNCPWVVFRFSTYDNPTLTKAQIDEIALEMSGMPEEAIQQQIFAQYATTLEAFPRWRECLGARQCPAEPGHTYSIAIDVGHRRDFCVISVVDRKTLHEVYLLRFKDPDWATQKLRLVSVCKMYPNSTIVIESNGPGDPVVEDLKREYRLTVEAIQKTARLKSMMINNFRVLIANKQIKLIDDPAANEELASYEIALNKANYYSGFAPLGKHDDTVDARLMAFWGVAGANSAIIPDDYRTTGERRLGYKLVSSF